MEEKQETNEVDRKRKKRNWYTKAVAFVRDTYS